jgi:hypothetical protein
MFKNPTNHFQYYPFGIRVQKYYTIKRCNKNHTQLLTYKREANWGWPQGLEELGELQ